MSINQRGDTLIEVVISIAILSVTLVTAFNIANLSFRIGSQARERTQAIYIAQDQAEKLRFYRDQLVSYAVANGSASNYVINQMQTSCGAQCYMVQIAGGKWVPNNCGGTCTAVAPFYNVKIVPATVPGSADEMHYTITVSWQNAAADVTNNSVLDLTLVDKRGIQPRNCDIAGAPLCI